MNLNSDGRKRNFENSTVISDHAAIKRFRLDLSVKMRNSKISNFVSLIHKIMHSFELRIYIKCKKCQAIKESNQIQMKVKHGMLFSMAFVAFWFTFPDSFGFWHTAIWNSITPSMKHPVRHWHAHVPMRTRSLPIPCYPHSALLWHEYKCII